MGENDLEILKNEFSDGQETWIKKLAYSYQYFNNIDEYRKPVKNLKREKFFSKLKPDYPSDKEIEITKEFIRFFVYKNGEELINLYCQSDILLFACVFEKFIKVLVNQFGNNLLYCVSL